MNLKTKHNHIQQQHKALFHQHGSALSTTHAVHPLQLPLIVSFKTLNGANDLPVHRMCNLYYTDSN